MVVSKDYKKKAGFEVGWNNKLYDLLVDYLGTNKDETAISYSLKNQVKESLGTNKIAEFDFTLKELNIESIICEIITKFYLNHKEIFQNDYSIGAIGIISVEDFYRIVLVLG